LAHLDRAQRPAEERTAARGQLQAAASGPGSCPASCLYQHNQHERTDCVVCALIGVSILTEVVASEQLCAQLAQRRERRQAGRRPHTDLATLDSDPLQRPILWWSHLRWP
jgi:hypothetical protein